MIEFLCPEGHKIRCPEEKAGRPAKCPRCGVGFRIPTIEELGLGESTVANDSLGGEEVADEPAPPPSPDDSGKQSAAADHEHMVAPSKERQIEFLCPNGHHLHGPASLQGRAGECPECRSRFRIPIIDEADAEEPLAEPGVAADDEISLDKPPPLPDPQQIESVEPLDFLQVLEGQGPGPPKIPGISGALGGAARNASAGRPIHRTLGRSGRGQPG